MRGENVIYSVWTRTIEIHGQFQPWKPSESLWIIHYFLAQLMSTVVSGLIVEVHVKHLNVPWKYIYSMCICRNKDLEIRFLLAWKICGHTIIHVLYVNVLRVISLKMKDKVNWECLYDEYFWSVNAWTKFLAALCNIRQNIRSKLLKMACLVDLEL